MANKDLLNLKVKYQNYLYPCYHSYQEVQTILNDLLDLTELTTLSSYWEHRLYMFKLFCVNTAINRSYNYTIDDLDVKVYEVQRNKKSALIYEYIDEQSPSDFLRPYRKTHILTDTKLQIFDCDCSILSARIHLYEGITAEDIANDSARLLLYLLCLDRIKKERPQFIL